MHLGIAGEVRCVITKADGTIKIDTGYQKNLILNQGLDFFGGNHGNSINTSCAIGSGNSTPAITQTKLDAFLALASGSDTTSDYSYVDEGDGLYKMWEQKKYRFTGLDNVNISELGLVSTGSTSENYFLTTRVLIKDSSGTPTSIGLKLGETLDIYYKIHKIIDTTDKSFVINMLNGAGGSVPYNIVVRPINIGKNQTHDVTSKIGITIGDNNNAMYLDIGSTELSGFTTSRPREQSIHMYGNPSVVGLGGYTENEYKRLLQFKIPLNLGNDIEIRRVGLNGKDANSNHPFGFLPFQMRLGRVSDDAPLTKTANDTLTIPLEVSWGRYEGEL